MREEGQSGRHRPLGRSPRRRGKRRGDAGAVGEIRSEEPLCEGDLASGLLRYSKGDSRQRDGLGMISYVVVTQRDPRECPELLEKP